MSSHEKLKKKGKSPTKSHQIDLIFYPIKKGAWCYPSVLFNKFEDQPTINSQRILNQQAKTRFKTATIFLEQKSKSNKSLPKLRKPLKKESFIKKNLNVQENKSMVFSNNNLNLLKESTVSLLLSDEQLQINKEVKMSQAPKQNSSKLLKTNYNINPLTMKTRPKTEMKAQENKASKPIKHQSLKSKDLKIKKKDDLILADERKELLIKNKFLTFSMENLKQISKPQINHPQITINPFTPPKIPEPPKKDLQVQEYIRSAHEIALIFSLEFNEFEVVIRRYKNCITFDAKNQTIIWHYEGKLYVGDWREVNKTTGEGFKDGQGFQRTESYSYKGAFEASKKHGFGIILHDNGNVYEGEWRGGKMEGKGTFYDKKTHAYYQGNWQSNHLTGHGVVKYSKKHFYEGEFLRSKKEGRGLEHFENGDIYEGEYKNGHMDGKGRYFQSNGKIYIGSFRKSKKEGVGLIYLAKSPGAVVKEYYYGEFHEGEKSGYGVKRMEDGCIFQGYFNKGMRHGPGFAINKYNLPVKGFWRNGNLEEINQSIMEDES